MRLSTVILPVHRWSEGQQVWRRAEELGFHAAYTYDHLSWRSFPLGSRPQQVASTLLPHVGAVNGLLRALRELPGPERAHWDERKA